MSNEEQLTADEKAATEAMQKAFGSSPELPARDATTGQFVATQQPKAVEQPKQPEKKPEPRAAKPAKEPSAPAAAPFAVTQAQWDDLVKKVTSFDSDRSKLNGTVGNLQKLVHELRSATPQGVQIELPPELEAEYPALAAHLKKAKIKGTASESPEVKPSITDEEVRKLINEAAESAQKGVDDKLRQARQKIEAEALDDLHPNWREIVGAGETHDPNNAYRKWLVTQTAEYQKLINETDSAVVIGRSIDKFKAAAKVQPANGKQAASVVNDRRRAAIQPKGDGGTPQPTTNEAHAAMLAAFGS